jgi:hypothetical protein
MSIEHHCGKQREGISELWLGIRAENTDKRVMVRGGKKPPIRRKFGEQNILI